MARLDPDSFRIRKIMEGYVEYELGHDGTQFMDARVYIRKTEVEPLFNGITR